MPVTVARCCVGVRCSQANGKYRQNKKNPERLALVDSMLAPISHSPTLLTYTPPLEPKYPSTLIPENQRRLRCRDLSCVKKTAESLRTRNAPTPQKRVGAMLPRPSLPRKTLKLPCDDKSAGFRRAIKLTRSSWFSVLSE